MRVVQINAIFGRKSTGTIVREIQACCEQNSMDCYVAYSIADHSNSDVKNGYRIGNSLTAKWSAFVSRIIGRQAYVNRLTTWRFLHWLGKVKPDIVHLHNLHNNYICLNMLLRYLAKHDIATVITLHDCWYYTGGCMHYTSVGCDRWISGCGNCPIWKRIPSWFCDATSAVLKDRSKYLNAIPRLTVVGASDWIANQVKMSCIKQKSITFIHNGFDLSIFKPLASNKRNELGIENRFVILGPANKWLSPINKQTLDYFIDRMTDDMRLVLFGNTSPSNINSNKVILLGYTHSRQEMAELYSMADVFVNCSREDTLSSINLECQACGTPVVTYDATGSRETVNEECGFAVKTADFSTLFERVSYIKQIGKQSLSQSCRDWIIANFDKHDNYQKYIDLYQSICKKK